MYPKIEININKINDNIKKVSKLCKENNIKLSLVTKVLSGNIDIINKLDLNYVDSISDSRIDNLKIMSNIDKEKWLIRIPTNSEIEEVIKYCDVSFNSNIYTIKLLNESAKKYNKVHKIILMYELGDLREGTTYDNLNSIIKETKKLNNIKIYGIGSNLTCYGGVEPTIDNSNEFFDIKNKLETENNIKFEVISAANSSSYKLLKKAVLKDKMNYVRFGESIFLGNIPGYEQIIEDYNQDSFIIKAQIAEIENKDSVPKGKILKNSFGEEPVFLTKGIRKRALINIGKQDVDVDIIPIDKKTKVLHGSSDYLIIDITDSDNKYEVGDILSFIPTYSSLLKCMTSKYVRKDIK